MEPLLYPSSVDPLPTEWPTGYANTRNNLTSLLTNGPQYEESCNGDVMSLFAHMFPVTAPENYVIKSQCNLRKPRLADQDEIRDEEAPRISIESRGHETAHSRTDANHEPELLQPDFVIDNGTCNAQRLVAIIELKQSQAIDRRGREHFVKYCGRVVEYDLNTTTGASAMMIAGGVAYAWTREQITIIAEEPLLFDERMQEAEMAEVDSVEFLVMLANIRNRFIQSIRNDDL